MSMMAESGKTYSEAELFADVTAKFGADARFHTCADSDLTAKSLVLFLTSKGKIVETEQGLSMPSSHLC